MNHIQKLSVTLIFATSLYSLAKDPQGLNQVNSDLGDITADLLEIIYEQSSQENKDIRKKKGELYNINKETQNLKNTFKFPYSDIPKDTEKQLNYADSLIKQITPRIEKSKQSENNALLVKECAIIATSIGAIAYATKYVSESIEQLATDNFYLEPVLLAFTGMSVCIVNAAHDDAQMERTSRENNYEKLLRSYEKERDSLITYKNKLEELAKAQKSVQEELIRLETIVDFK